MTKSARSHPSAKSPRRKKAKRAARKAAGRGPDPAPATGAPDANDAKAREEAELDRFLAASDFAMAESPLERMCRLTLTWSGAQFADWLTTGVQNWLAFAQDEGRQVFAFDHYVLSSRPSLQSQLIALYRHLPAPAMRSFEAGLTQAIVNWNGLRDSRVLHHLLDVAQYLRPNGLAAGLHRFLGTQVLSRDSARPATLNHLVGLAASYPFNDDIALFFRELRARGHWRPEFAASLLMARTAASPADWLSHLSDARADFEALERTRPDFNFKRVLSILISTAGLAAIMDTIFAIAETTADPWIGRILGDGPDPVLRRQWQDDIQYFFDGTNRLAIASPASPDAGEQPKKFFARIQCRETYLQRHFTLWPTHDAEQQFQHLLEKSEGSQDHDLHGAADTDIKRTSLLVAISRSAKGGPAGAKAG